MSDNARLVVVSGVNQGTTFSLKPGTGHVLGRQHGSTYPLTDLRVSRRHCEIHSDGNVVQLVDNGSTGGTFVNGTRISKHLLTPGDIIRLGDTELRFEASSPELHATLAPAAPAPRTATHEPAVPVDSGLPSSKPKDEKKLTPTALKQVGDLSSLEGKTLGRFQIHEPIGKGSTGLVFDATDGDSGHLVALKVMKPDFAESEEDVQRFIRAMRTIMPLQHPHLIRVLGAGRSGPFCWISMERVEGDNMKQVFRRIGIQGMLDWKYGFRVCVHVARALEFIHSKNIVHRNLTPTSVLIESDTKICKLGDLVLTKALEGKMAKQITKPGEILGDVNYLSPEQTKGDSQALDERSDLFNLGALTYALLTGSPPFAAANMIETIARIHKSDPESPNKYQINIPRSMSYAVLKLLEKSPEKRYQTATDLLEELTRIGRAEGLKAELFKGSIQEHHAQERAARREDWR